MSVKRGLLTQEEFDILKKWIAANQFVPYPLGNGVQMIVCPLADEIKEKILGYVEEMCGKKLKIVEMYCRYNSPDMDPSFRIHSDGLIKGVQPDVASVLYLTTGDTGTALLRHPEHGYEGRGKVFTQDDGRWKVIQYCAEEENTCFVYNANHFHSRWPPKAYSDRFVIVGFYTEEIDHR